MNCATCHYYTRTPQEKKWSSGRCHRLPPTVVQLGDPEQRRACFPLVDESEWCGEYRASERVDGPTNRELMLDILATLRELTKPETKEN